MGIPGERAKLALSATNNAGIAVLTLPGRGCLPGRSLLLEAVYMHLSVVANPPSFPPRVRQQCRPSYA